MGVWTTKIHAVVDALGNPLRIILSVGQQADLKQAESLLADYKTSAVIADRGYDADALLDWLANAQVEMVIPAKKNRLVERPIDENLYKDRSKVERYFNKLNRAAEAGNDNPHIQPFPAHELGKQVGEAVFQNLVDHPRPFAFGQDGRRRNGLSDSDGERIRKGKKIEEDV